MTVASKSPVKMAGDDPSAVEAQRISGEIAIDRATVRRAAPATPPPPAGLADESDDDAVAPAEGPASDPAPPRSPPSI